MALFPKIQSPCPFKGDIAAVMDGDVCRLCKRQVFDLNTMREEERLAFLKSCSGEICVTYRFPVRPALAAAAIAMASLAPTAVAACEDVTTVVISMGGIKDPANAQYVQVPDDKKAPELPVVYEAKPAPQPAKAPS